LLLLSRCCARANRDLHAIPTRRSSDLTGERKPMTADDQVCVSGLLESGAALSIHYRGGRSRGTNLLWEINGTEGDLQLTAAGGQDRKSTRLNSSHVAISYAVFCLKKKT